MKVNHQINMNNINTQHENQMMINQNNHTNDMKLLDIMHQNDLNNMYINYYGNSLHNNSYNYNY